MRWIPNFILSAGIVVIVGAGTLWFTHTPPQGPPTLSSHANVAVVLKDQAFPPIDDLLPPWFEPRPHVALPAPVRSAPAKSVDRTSVAYLGSYTNAAGVLTYFFKFIPNKQYLQLALDQSANGWKLTGADKKQFSLEGPGGLYEVVR